MTIEQQLKQLKTSLNPTAEATQAIRNTLTKRAIFLSSINHGQSVSQSVQLGVWQTYRFTFAHMRQVVAIAVVVAISTGGTLMAKASLAAVPGDSLYSIKRNIEKVELVMAPTAQDEANVYLKHVATRLDEIRVLNERVNISDEAKAEHINQTVLALNRDLTSARQSLQIAAKNNAKSSGAAVVAVARGLTKSTTEVKAALASASASAKGELSQSASEAISSADEASVDSLQILLDTYSQDPQQVDRSELASLVGDTLAQTEARQQATAQAVALSSSLEVRTKVQRSLYSISIGRKPAPFAMPTYDSLRSDALATAERQLDEASAALSDNSFKAAVNWNSQAKVTLDGIDAVLKQASNLAGVPILPESTIAATSTSPATTTSPTATTTAAQVPTHEPDPAAAVDPAVETTASQLKK